MARGGLKLGVTWVYTWVNKVVLCLRETKTIKKTEA